MEEKQILDRLWDTAFGELSYEDARAQKRGAGKPEQNKPSHRRELRREISALGTPNIGAIEEFDRVSTRYEYLSEQRGDVEKSQRKSCWVSSAALPRRCSAFSKEQFALINESFQQTFLELFGGGQAQLELEDEDI